MLPPGRPRLATRPASTGSLLTTTTIGISSNRGRFALAVAFLMTGARSPPNEKITGLEAYQFIREFRNARVISRRVAVLEANGLAIDVTERFETANERVDNRKIELGKQQDADARDVLCLLRARRERPCHHHAASDPDEIAPFHVHHGFLPKPSRRLDPASGSWFARVSLP